MALSRNESSVLRAVTILGSPTRKAISEHSGLGLVLVTSTLASLLESGRVTRVSSLGGKGGRPAHLYRVSGSVGRVVGVSVEPQRLRLVSADAAGSVTASRTVPLELSADPTRHPSEIVERIAAGVASLGQADALPLLQVGVTLPGVTDADEGMWVQGFQVSGIQRFGIRDPLEQGLGVPVVIEDPARAAAFRELRQAAARTRSFVLVYLDYGVGSGIVLDGELHRGRAGLSGEIGHLVVDPQGYRCSCGDVGCLETVASTSGILRLVRERLAEGVISSLSAPGRGQREIGLEDLLRAADAGDRLALSVLNEVGDRIGTACATLVKILGPEALVVSGACAVFARYFEPRIRMMLERHVIPEMLSGLAVRFCDHRPEDEAHGVALMALERYWDQAAAAGRSRAAERSTS